MTVIELIRQLNDMDPNLQVILQKDSEGNGYSPLSDADDDCIYVADSTYSGDVYSRKDYLDEEITGGEKCVVLYPIN